MPTRRLPVSPQLNPLKNQAKQLVKDHRSGQVDAFARIKASFPRLSDASVQDILSADFTLCNAHLVLAREYGYPTWEELSTAVEDSAVALNQNGSPFDNPSLGWIRQAVEAAAATNLPALVTGQVGTGKVYVSKVVHQLSSRKRGPFLQVLSTGVSDVLILSELFGHEKDAFTGAHARKLGAVERGRLGTLFVDEVDMLSLHVQGKLLRLCSDGTFERLGGEETLESEVRLMAGTGRDLIKLASESVFNEELAFLLQQVRVDQPSLRHRRDDIPEFAAYIIRWLSTEMRSEVQSLDDGALNALKRYDWPGNARELVGRMRQALTACDGPVVTKEDLGF